ncbi:MAG: segregation/condensation protein A, partial [Planctomycetota bacterium]|nr:segregation/condensation protein A [Planctomycetota bacterium]
DLLLYLVRRQEVDILDLPMAGVTAQFLEFLEVLQILDLDFIGEFVVIASSLVEIKSRMVLPQDVSAPEIVEREEDPRSELVRQLLEYKRFKEASQLLEEQSALWQQRYPRLSDDRPRGSGDPSQDLFKEVELWDLVSALSRVLRKHSEATPAKVIYDDTPIAVYIEQIKARVDTEERVAFSSFFAGTNSRSRIVGIFLAILELLRHQKYRAEQPVAYHEIWILPPLAQVQTDGGAGQDANESSAEPLVAEVPETTSREVAAVADCRDDGLEAETSPVGGAAAAGGDEPMIFRMPDPGGTERAADEPPPATGTGTGA